VDRVCFGGRKTSVWLIAYSILSSSVLISANRKPFYINFIAIR
jgi:hypothetical protein